MMQEPVHQSISDVAREIRGLVQSLKEATRRNELPGKETEFQRKNLRKLYLKLLLSHPNSKEAKDAESQIWIHTSYQFISVYKQQIATLDRKLFSLTSQNGKGSPRQHHGEGGRVEYSKLLQRFRRFLEEEEKFYTQLLLRFRVQFGLTETHPTLVKAEVLSSDSEELAPPNLQRNVFPEQQEMPPNTTEERNARLAAFVKLLVCLGDLARYREQYNDGGGRPRAGHEEGAPRRPRRGGRKGGNEVVARRRNYSRAQTIYEQARLLAPDDGNAAHQLAILSSYRNDSFASTLYYYRALCVRQPYDTAPDNLNTVLRKSLDQFKATKRSDKSSTEGNGASPQLRVDRLKEWVVVLHCLWFFDADENSSRATKLSRNVISEFRSLISERILPSNTVYEVIVLAIGAQWKFRMVRDSSVRTNLKVVEPLIASHILDLSRVLFVMGHIQLADKPDEAQDQEDLAQLITAVFRRTLPAIRIVLKWLRSNLSYIETSMSSNATSSCFLSSIREFWPAFAEFFTSLSQTFPASRLPSLNIPLEEDVDMAGFSPIKKFLFKSIASTSSKSGSGQNMVHPNEEYLMRISDLLEDACQISAVESSPISFVDNRFSVKETARDSDVPFDAHLSLLAPADSLANIGELHPDHPQAASNSDEDSTTGATRTEDDVIREAFNEALGDHETLTDDEEDQIVWSPPRIQASSLKATKSIEASPEGQTAFASAAHGSLSPKQQGHSTSTTAQDLLNNVLGSPRGSGSYSSRAVPSAPQASLLFGSGTISDPRKSIWSDSSTGANPVDANAYSMSQYQSVSSHSRSTSMPWPPQARPVPQNDALMNTVPKYSTPQYLPPHITSPFLGKQVLSPASVKEPPEAYSGLQMNLTSSVAYDSALSLGTMPQGLMQDQSIPAYGHTVSQYPTYKTSGDNFGLGLPRRFANAER